jgi:hypothetical protein
MDVTKTTTEILGSWPEDYRTELGIDSVNCRIYHAKGVSCMHRGELKLRVPLILQRPLLRGFDRVHLCK